MACSSSRRTGRGKRAAGRNGRPEHPQSPEHPHQGEHPRPPRVAVLRRRVRCRVPRSMASFEARQMFH
eukprot:7260838-Prymnesium_polylepis.2